MEINEKISIKLFGINFAKVKKIKSSVFKIYVFGIPIFYCKIKTGKAFLNFIFIEKFINFLNYVFITKQLDKKKKQIKEKYKRGEKIKIIVQVSRPRMWSFEYLIKILNNNPQFDTKILIMPDNNYSQEQSLKYVDETYDELLKLGHNPIKGYDYKNKKPLNIRKKFNPDIVFYSDFWKPHFAESFYISNFRDKITFLSEYGYSVMQDELTCNFELNNLVDLYFRPSDVHLALSQKLMDNKGKNVVVTGSPKLDYRFDKDYKPIDIWKAQNKPKKRIIWAPHYNCNNSSTMYSNDGFWVLYDFMFDVLKQFEDKVQFVFRPHPVLYPKLIEKWGKEKTDAYYKKWDDISNGQVFMDNFVDLFMTSDAMIMDSCSFMAEYTAFDKPLFHTVTKTSRTNLNEFGELLYKNLYTPENNLEDDIIKFIQNVVIGGNDYKSAARHKFVEKYFGKINNCTASENIYNEIIKYLNN